MKFSMLEKVKGLEKKTLVKAGAACGIVAIAALVFFVSGGYFNKASAADETPDYTLRAYSVNELQGGVYYVKDGMSFYPVVGNALLSTREGDTLIPTEADPDHRMAMLFQNDQQLPTLYKDCQLVYKSPSQEELSALQAEMDMETIAPGQQNALNPNPSEFFLERFRDEGYSIGIRGLSNLSTNGGKYKTTITNQSIYPGTSISALQVNLNDDLTIDKVNGIPLSEDNVSSAGTVRGLSQGNTYTVDAYVGTSYVGMDAAADTHMFTSYELYDLTDYSMDPAGYLIIEIPDYMWSGYYNINGQGMFRYVNGFKADGKSGVDYNTQYFLGVNADNNIITNPASDPKDLNALYLEEEEAENPLKWHYDITIDNQQKRLNVNVSFSDAMALIDGRLVSETEGAEIPGKEIPRAVITSPSGFAFDLVDYEGNVPGTATKTEETDKNKTENPENFDENLKNQIMIEIDNPETGTWSLDVTGMYARTFDVYATYTGSNTNMIVKDGEDPAQMTVYIPHELVNGSFIFTWENKQHAGIFTLMDADGKLYGNKVPENSRQEINGEILKESYGEVEIGVDYAPAGEYTVTIEGRPLGHVYFTYDNGTGEVEDEAEPEEETEEVPEEEEVEDVEGKDIEQKDIEGKDIEGKGN